MQFSDEFLAKWEHIVDEVHKTEVPLECIKKVIVKLKGGKQRTINLSTLKRQGLNIEQIEVVLSKNLSEFGDSVKDLEFVIDVGTVAELVQPETDKLLKKL